MGFTTNSGFFCGVHDELRFFWGGSRRDRFFSGRAFVPVVFFTTRGQEVTRGEG